MSQQLVEPYGPVEVHINPLFPSPVVSISVSPPPFGAEVLPEFKDKLLSLTSRISVLNSVFLPFTNKLPLISTLPLISIVNTFPVISFVPKARRTFELSSVILATLPNKIYDDSGFCENDAYEQSNSLLYPAIKALLRETSGGALISLLLPCIKQLLPEYL